MKFDIDEKISRYIRLKRSFVFREALIITGASKDYLEASLNRLIKDGRLKLEKSDGSLLKRIYRVIQENEKNNKTSNMKFLKLVVSVCKEIKKEEDENIDFLKLFNFADTDKNLFLKMLDSMDRLGILETIEEKRKYKVDLLKIESLLTFFKQKKYDLIQEIINGKKALRYVEVPEDLPKILNAIIDNDVLKRDEISLYAGVTRKRLTDWWQVLKKLGITIDSFKENKKDRVTYIFNSKRAKLILKHLNEGAYEKDKELKHLWMQ